MLRDFHAVTIAEVKRETPDAISVAFAVPEALREAFRFQAGQHLTLRTSLDDEEVAAQLLDLLRPRRRAPHRHQARRRRLLLRLGQRSAGSRQHDRCHAAPGALRPAGERRQRPRHVVAIAAGAGITPILAMVKQALLHEPATSFTLVYGNRTPDSILFREELEDLKDRYLGRFTLLHVLSRNDESSAPLFEGRITGDKIKALSDKLFRPENVAHVFLCGPGSMIKETRNALFALGFAREQGASRVLRARRRRVPQGHRRRRARLPCGSQPKWRAPRSSRSSMACAIEFTVPPGEHVVDAALAAGVRVPYACKGGMCCTCRAKLVEGKAEMTTNYSLEPWEIERGFILTCQAVPKSDRLVLDYDQM